MGFVPCFQRTCFKSAAAYGTRHRRRRLYTLSPNLQFFPRSFDFGDFPLVENPVVVLLCAYFDDVSGPFPDVVRFDLFLCYSGNADFTALLGVWRLTNGGPSDVLVEGYVGT